MALKVPVLSGLYCFALRSEVNYQSWARQNERGATDNLPYYHRRTKPIMWKLLSLHIFSAMPITQEMMVLLLKVKEDRKEEEAEKECIIKEYSSLHQLKPISIFNVLKLNDKRKENSGKFRMRVLRYNSYFEDRVFLPVPRIFSILIFNGLNGSYGHISPTRSSLFIHRDDSSVAAEFV